MRELSTKSACYFHGKTTFRFCFLHGNRLKRRYCPLQLTNLIFTFTVVFEDEGRFRHGRKNAERALSLLRFCP